MAPDLVEARLEYPKASENGEQRKDLREIELGLSEQVLRERVKDERRKKEEPCHGQGSFPRQRRLRSVLCFRSRILHFGARIERFRGLPRHRRQNGRDR